MQVSLTSPPLPDTLGPFYISKKGDASFYVKVSIGDCCEPTHGRVSASQLSQSFGFNPLPRTFPCPWLFV